MDELRAVVALSLGDYRAATATQAATRAGAWLHDAAAVSDALRAIEGQPGRVAAAIRREAQASLAAIEGRRSEARAEFTDAVRRWRELGMEFEAAVCRLSLVTMLGSSEPETSAAAAEAGAVFERLGAVPFQELLAAASRAAAPAHPRTGGSPIEEARRSTARAD